MYAVGVPKSNGRGSGEGRGGVGFLNIYYWYLTTFWCLRAFWFLISWVVGRHQGLGLFPRRLPPASPALLLPATGMIDPHMVHVRRRRSTALCAPGKFAQLCLIQNIKCIHLNSPKTFAQPCPHLQSYLSRISFEMISCSRDHEPLQTAQSSADKSSRHLFFSASIGR